MLTMRPHGRCREPARIAVVGGRAALLPGARGGPRRRRPGDRRRDRGTDARVDPGRAGLPGRSARRGLARRGRERAQRGTAHGGAGRTLPGAGRAVGPGWGARRARRGARLFERSALASAAWRGGLWEARVLAGTGAAGCVVRARTLVIAANAWAPRICPGLAELIAPRRGQMLSTAPIGREVAPCPVSARYGYRYW